MFFYAQSQCRISCKKKLDYAMRPDNLVAFQNTVVIDGYVKSQEGRDANTSPYTTAVLSR